jgi:hypothetical protein
MEKAMEMGLTLLQLYEPQIVYGQGFGLSDFFLIFELRIHILIFSLVR